MIRTASNLAPGSIYQVKRPFTDYDGVLHPVGETWRFLEKGFLPAEDGLTLHVEQDGQQWFIRLQWRKETQAEIIEHFSDYVEPLAGYRGYISPGAQPGSNRPHTRRAAFAGVAGGFVAGVGLGLLLVCILAVGFAYYMINALSYHPGQNSIDHTKVDINVISHVYPRLNQTFPLQVQIDNHKLQPQTLDDIAIDAAYLEGASVVRSEPPFKNFNPVDSPGGKYTLYHFGVTIQPNSSLLVKFILTAHKTGEFNGYVRVCLNGSSDCTVEHARSIISQ
jgi:hypothetical protein